MILQENSIFHSRYQLITKIGAGGYSQVWLAEDTEAGNLQVALKIFAPGQGLDTQGLSLFSKEYAIVFNLNHGNLLKPMHFAKCDGSPYLVLPYCANGSVFGMVGETDETTLAHFMQQACSALEYLHEQEPPIIHQDIKPDNFLIDNKGNFLLSDFGISSKIRRTLTRSMGEQTSAGTTAYMAPERFSKSLDERKPIKANDIFSLGVTLFELLTGELAYGELGGILANTGNEPADLPSKFSSELGQLLHLCMHPHAHNRPTATELKDSALYFIQKGVWQIPERLQGVAPPQPTPTGNGSGRSTQQMPGGGGQGTQKIHGSGGRGTQPIPTPLQPTPEPVKKRSTWPYWLLGVAAVVVVMFLIENSNYAIFTSVNDDHIEIEEVVEEVVDSSASNEEGFENKNLNEQSERYTAEKEQRQQQNSGTFRDSRDGKTYKWVKIGKQVWMAENLAYMPISGNYWVYDNNQSNVAKYGYLYDWETAKNVCPTGWHLPSDAEWTQLTKFLGSNPGALLKSKNGWDKNGDGTDDFGFAILPGGRRYARGNSDYIGIFAFFWSNTNRDASNAWIRYLGNYYHDVSREYSGMNNGFSVRCLRD